MASLGAPRNRLSVLCSLGQGTNTGPSHCNLRPLSSFGAPQVVLVVKNLPANAGDLRDMDLIPGPERSPGRGHGNPLQYCHLKNPHGQRSLTGYSPWGVKELDVTEAT